MTIPPADAAPALPGLAALSALLSDETGPIALPDAPDWPAAVSLAVRHGLGPVAFQRLERTGDACPLPPESRDALHRAFVTGAAAGLRIRADAGAALGALATAGVDVLVLKGLHLASAYYAHPGLRSMSDLDLLVRPAHSRAAWDVLCDLGYAAAERGREYREFHLSRHLPPLYRPGRISIELHRTIGSPGDPFRIDLDLLWQRSRAIEVAGHPVRALCPEDLLLHLCLHSAHQHLCRVPLRNVYDVALVVRRCGWEMDWDLLAATAEAFGTARPVFCGLLLARETFGAAVPEPVLDALAPGANREALLGMALAAVATFDAPVAGWLKVAAAGSGAWATVRGIAARVLGLPYLIPEANRAVTWHGLLRGAVRRPIELLLRYRRLLLQLALFRPAARAQLRTARAAASMEAWLTSTE